VNTNEEQEKRIEYCVFPRTYTIVKKNNGNEWL